MFSETVAFLFLLFSRLLSFPSSSGMVLSRLDTGVGEEPEVSKVSEEGRCKAQAAQVKAAAAGSRVCPCTGSCWTQPGSPAGPALTRFPGILDCLVQVFVSKVSVLVFPLIQILLHGAQGIFHSRSCFIGLGSCRFGILDSLFCVLWKERRKISGMARSGEEEPFGHSLGTRKGAERTSLATPAQTLVPAQHVLHRLELAQELLLLCTEVSQLVLCCLQSAFNSCN